MFSDRLIYAASVCEAYSQGDLDDCQHYFSLLLKEEGLEDEEFSKERFDEIVKQISLDEGGF